MGGHGFGVLHRNAPEIARATREFQIRTENQQWETYVELTQKVKDELRKVFNIPESHEIAFDSNTTAFHNKLIPSIHKKGSPIITTDVEFHALWRSSIALVTHDQASSLEVVKYKDGKTFQSDLENKLKETRNATLLISHVSSNRQTCFEINPILKIAAQNQIKVVLDLTQSIGNVVFNLSFLEGSNCSALFSGIKYLHCGQNFGVCIFPKDLQNTSTSTGWFANPETLAQAASSFPENQFTESLQFNGATPGNIDSLALDFTTLLAYQTANNSPKEHHTVILKQQKYVLSQLNGIPNLLLSQRTLHLYKELDPYQSNTLIFDLGEENVNVEKVVHYLYQNGIVVDAREGRFIRMGFQPNLTIEQLNHLADVLKLTTKKMVEQTEYSPIPKTDFLSQLTDLSK